MRASTKQLLLLAFLLNVMSLTTVQADEEIDADFLEFLADMEETTGSGFDAWLNDENEDNYSTNTNEETESTELKK